MDAITKTCTKCGVDKALQEYNRHPLGKHGHVAHCKDCERERRKAYRATPEAKARSNAYMKAYRASPEGKARIAAHIKAYRATPKAKANRKAYMKAYHATPKAKAYRKAYTESRLKTDPQYAMVQRLRCRLNKALNGQIKTESTMALVGCSPEKLCAWLEMHFDEGMTWHNRHLWHIDHIRPIASFDNPADPACWHWSNLQPLWAEDNLTKSDKY